MPHISNIIISLHRSGKSALFILILFFLTSCENIFLGEKPTTDNIAVFEEFASIFKEKYAMFEYKQVDWEAEVELVRGTITPDMSSQELFEAMAALTLLLRDGHSSLQGDTDDQFANYDFTEGFDLNIDLPIIVQNYTQGQITTFANDGFFARILSSNVGYVFIPSFSIDWTESTVDSLIDFVKNTDALLLDVRLNTGGDPNLADEIASRLTEQEYFTGEERFKTGPGENDFSSSRVFLRPSESTKYLKPVAILTNRYCYSATTTLYYQTLPLPNVISVGDRLGGGTGSVADGFMANGWKWQMSVSEFILPDGTKFDDGIDPTFKVQLDTLNKNKDEIIEKAILELL